MSNPSTGEAPGSTLAPLTLFWVFPTPGLTIFCQHPICRKHLKKQQRRLLRPARKPLQMPGPGTLSFFPLAFQSVLFLLPATHADSYSSTFLPLHLLIIYHQPPSPRQRTDAEGFKEIS